MSDDSLPDLSRLSVREPQARDTAPQDGQTLEIDIIALNREAYNLDQ